MEYKFRSLFGNRFYPAKNSFIISLVIICRGVNMRYSRIQCNIGNACGIVGAHADNRQFDSCFPESAIDELFILFLKA